MSNGTIDTDEERRNVEAVRRAYDGYSRGDPQPFFDICAPDIRFGIAAAPEHFSYAGVREGADWVRHVIAEVGKEFAWEKFENRQIIAEGEWIIGLSGGLLRDRDSDELIDAELVDVIRMRNGKIVYMVEYVDTGLLQKRDAARARKAAAAR